MDKTESGRAPSGQALGATPPEPVPVSAHSGDGPSRSAEFDRLICAAARRVVEAKLFEGPVDMGRSFEEHLANLSLKKRMEERRAEALFEVVLFAKVHGEEIVAGRDSDTRRQAETGTGSVRSTGSATPQGDRP